MESINLAFKVILAMSNKNNTLYFYANNLNAVKPVKWQIHDKMKGKFCLNERKILPKILSKSQFFLNWDIYI